ncbi:MAG TPA: DinB family protein [Vicinamibacterales bacterium]|jgi:hypothetical protein|nr:DinB family protein [Vicinamibacterales bacterium]
MHPHTKELLDYLHENRRILRAAVDGVTPSLRDEAPPKGGWSVANVLEHLAIVEKRVAMRIAASIGEARNAGLGPDTGTAPILPTVNVKALFDRERKITASEAVQPTGALNAAQAWEALEESTNIVHGTLLDADGLDIGMLAMPHPVLGSASLHAWFAFIGAHEGRHAHQISEVGRLLLN